MGRPQTIHGSSTIHAIVPGLVTARQTPLGPSFYFLPPPILPLVPFVRFLSFKHR